MTHDTIRVIGLIAAAATALPSCAAGGESSDEAECRSGAECASGVCLGSGRCAPVQSDAGSDASTDVTSQNDAAPDSAADSAPPQETGGDAPAVDPDASEAGACADDGVIESGEAMFQAGVEADYRVSSSVSPFDSAGTCNGSVCTWDFVALNASTKDEKVRNAPLQDQWFAHEAEFANATYASLLGPVTIGVCTYVEYGVYRLEGDALLLVGLVSETDDLYARTKLVFEPAVPVLKFPLQKGAAWSVDTVATGRICDSALEYQIDQTYSFDVDKSGTLKVPAGDYSALRVNMLMERKVGVGVTSTKQRTHLFVSPCAPTLARIVGPDGSDAAEFQQAELARRLLKGP